LYRRATTRPVNAPGSAPAPSCAASRREYRAAPEPPGLRRGAKIGRRYATVSSAGTEIRVRARRHVCAPPARLVVPRSEPAKRGSDEGPRRLVPSCHGPPARRAAEAAPRNQAATSDPRLKPGATDVSSLRDGDFGRIACMPAAFRERARARARTSCAASRRVYRAAPPDPRLKPGATDPSSLRDGMPRHGFPRKFAVAPAHERECARARPSRAPTQQNGRDPSPAISQFSILNSSRLLPFLHIDPRLVSVRTDLRHVHRLA
jgi:hypothetical protein